MSSNMTQIMTSECVATRPEMRRQSGAHFRPRWWTRDRRKPET